jgi:hypothetical protein
MVGWLVCWLVGQLAGWLVSWFISCSVSQLISLWLFETDVSVWPRISNLVWESSITAPTLSNNSTLFIFDSVKNNVFTSQDTNIDEDHITSHKPTIPTVIYENASLTKLCLWYSKITHRQSIHIHMHIIPKYNTVLVNQQPTSSGTYI